MKLFALNIASLCCVAGGQLAAQAPPRPLSLVPELRLDAKQVTLQRGEIVAVGPNGHVITAAQYWFGDIQGFDSTGKRLPWKVMTGRSDSAEIMWPTRIGWMAGTNTMWVSDEGYHQVVLVDDKGKVFKSIEDPSWIHPSWAERRKYPVFARMEAQAVYADQTMLVTPSRERSLIDTPGYDRSKTHLLRISWSGAIQRTVALLPPEDQGRVVVHGKGCDRTIGVPMAARTYWDVTNDGARIIVAAPGATAADSGGFRLIALDDKGDTVFSRRYVSPSVRVPQESVDNFMATMRPCGTWTADQLRAEAAKQVPVFRSPLLGLRVGSDHSSWVMLRPVSDTTKERKALVIDARGDAVGTVVLPLNETVVAVARDHLWTMELSRVKAPVALLRYRVEATAAPPARSGRASASSTPSRPPT